MTLYTIISAALFGSASCALGQGASLDLSNYRLTRIHELSVSEASAVAYNPDRGTLFVVSDGAGSIVECSRTGVELSMVFLSGFNDTEGLAYVGDGRFAIAEERIQTISLLTWPTNPLPISTTSRTALPRVSLGPDVGNSGIEGICLDPMTGSYFAVKEKSPQRLLRVDIDFLARTASVVDQFPPESLGLSDIADIAVLSNVTRLAESADRDNLLVLSQESSRLVEATREGVVRSQFDLSPFSGQAEGVTIDEDGVIYIVDESPRLYVLEPCRADFNRVGGVTVQDIFDFLDAWFRGFTGQTSVGCHGANANFDGLGGVDVQDIFDFLNAWFLGCP